MTVSLNVATLIVQVVVAIYVYGRLTEKVKNLGDRTVDHGRRISNIESVVSGPGGHGERVTALEAWRIETRAKQ